MSIWSKIGGFLKKAAPIAAPLAALIPGVGPLVSAGIAGASGLFSSKSAAEGSPDFMGPPNPNQVHVTGSSGGTNWSGLLKDSLPLVTGAMNYFGQERTNAANAQMAQQQMDFQAAQTGSSWQRGVADMKAAGLNPMLAYSQGGAQSGAGSTAQMGNSLGEGANSAFSAAQTMAALKNAASQNELTNAQTAREDATTENIQADTLDKLKQPGLTLARTGEAGSRTRNLDEATKGIAISNWIADATKHSQISLASSTADLRRHEAAAEKYGLSGRKAYSDYFDTAAGRSEPYLRLGGEVLNSAGAAFRKFVPFGR